MKKIFGILITALLACCFALSFSACIEGGVEEHKQIVAEYAQLHGGDKSKIDYRCYGQFDGTHVMVIQPQDYALSPAINHVAVDGVDFYFRAMISFDVYRYGEFYTLQEAFDNGWLSHDNLLTVRKNHMTDNQSLYEEYGSV